MNKNYPQIIIFCSLFTACGDSAESTTARSISPEVDAGMIVRGDSGNGLNSTAAIHDGGQSINFPQTRIDSDSGPIPSSLSADGGPPLKIQEDSGIIRPADPPASTRPTVSYDTNGFLRVLQGQTNDAARLTEVLTAAGWPAVEKARFEHSYFTDEDLPGIPPSTGLKQLSLSFNPPLSPDVFGKALRSWPNLENLWLIWMNLTDAHLREIPSYETLQEIELSRNRDITPKGLGEAIARWPHLKKLTFNYMKNLNDYLLAIPVNNEIEVLILWDSKPITVEGLRASICKWPAIRRIVFNGTDITDAHLEALAEIPTLREVDPFDTEATPEGIADLKRRNPNIETFRYDWKD